MSEVRFGVRSSGGEGGNMQVVYRRCGGLDVHKDTITATVLVFGEEGQRDVRKQEFVACRCLTSARSALNGNLKTDKG
jgi:hypothetical protein